MFARRCCCCMLFSAACTVALLASSLNTNAAATPFPYSWNTLYYTAQVDNFNFASSGQTYQMKYLVNKQWAQPGGPIFFYAGNEAPIELFANNTGFMWDIAPQFNATLVFAEHRYYGDHTSWPLGDNSFTPAGLVHLSAEQALADYAGLITYLKQSWNMTDTPVIAFGGSYGGTLAAWLRKKYPHIVAGAISSSAAIWFFDSVAQPFDAGSFMRHASNDYAAVSQNCYNTIAASWTAIQSYATKYSVQQLSADLGLCTLLTDPANITNDIFPWVAFVYSTLAMGDYPYPSTFLGPLPANPVSVACGYFSSANMTIEDQVVAARKVVDLFYNFTGQAGACHNLTNEQGVATLSSGYVQWGYQTCTELIIPIGQYGPPNDFFYPAPWNLTAQQIYCQQTYGVTLQDYWVERQFGIDATSWLGASNIVFSNGDLDPWLGGGVLNSISDTVVALTVVSGAHHLDFRSANPADPPGVIWARQQEVQWIQTFIDNPNPTAGACTNSGLSKGQVALLSVVLTIICGALGLGVYYYCQRKSEETVAHPAIDSPMSQPREDGKSRKRIDNYIDRYNEATTPVKSTSTDSLTAPGYQALSLN